MRWPLFLTGLTPGGEPYHLAGRWGAYASHLRGYMHRWIVRTPWGGLRLHHILRADTDGDPHDHAWDFTSLILSGGYSEALEDGALVDGRRLPLNTHHARGSLVRRRAEDAHRIYMVEPNTWTLVLTGPKRRSWGFQTPAGWVPWRMYCGVEK